LIFRSITFNDATRGMISPWFLPPIRRQSLSSLNRTAHCIQASDVRPEFGCLWPIVFASLRLPVFARSRHDGVNHILMRVRLLGKGSFPHRLRDQKVVFDNGDISTA
jgi:hypothetical protein